MLFLGVFFSDKFVVVVVCVREVANNVSEIKLDTRLVSLKIRTRIRVIDLEQF